MQMQKVAGVALIAIGFLVFSGVIPLMTIIFPKYFWYQLYPDGASQTSPTLITPGQQITVSIKLVYHDSTENVELPPPTYWIVKVRISSGGTTVKTIDFGLRDNVISSVQIDSHLCTVAVWQEPWTAPSGEGVLYVFDWYVQIKDSAGKDYGTKTKTTYAKTALLEPDGVFKVNGQEASQTSALVVLEPTLNFAFTATKNPDKITAVKVVIQKGTAAEYKALAKTSDTEYSGSYTLPSYGTYEVKGFIEWSSGSPIQKMSITLSYGQGEEENPLWQTITSIPLSYIVGFALAALGGVLLIRHKKRRR